MTITIDPSEISIAYDACQPIGGYGFRKGYWTVLYKGERHQVYESVPHASDMEIQYQRVRKTAAREISEKLNREACLT